MEPMATKVEATSNQTLKQGKRRQKTVQSDDDVHLFQELCEGVGSRLQLGGRPHGLADIFEHLEDRIGVHRNLGDLRPVSENGTEKKNGKNEMAI